MRIFLPSLRRAGAFLLREVHTNSFSKCDKSDTKTSKDHDGTKTVTNSKRTCSSLPRCD